MLSRLFGKSTPQFEPDYRVLMVCMGNICRSPTAEAVLRHKLKEAGLHERVWVDSAGTHAYHEGSPPDDRSQRHALQRGYDLSEQRARRVEPQDYEVFDLILAMDWDNLALLEDGCPQDPGMQRKLKRLAEFVPDHSPLAGAQVVPDPYYGGPAGFDAVLDLVEAACEGLVWHIQEQLARSQGSGQP
ncbi:MAG TPA: low molecular weight protein-tyrosine-phosphatase [Aquabacterium sp.]|nr:low molecular weight protein-tyrosine-phosphatase [Aquabacterium sp.]